MKGVGIGWVLPEAASAQPSAWHHVGGFATDTWLLVAESLSQNLVCRPSSPPAVVSAAAALIIAQMFWFAKSESRAFALQRVTGAELPCGKASWCGEGASPPSALSLCMDLTVYPIGSTIGLQVVPAVHRP